MEGLKDGILDGQIPVIIMPDGLKGNGYLNAMYPYLFLYIGAFLTMDSLAQKYHTEEGFECEALIFVNMLIKSAHGLA